MDGWRGALAVGIVTALAAVVIVAIRPADPEPIATATGESTTASTTSTTALVSTTTTTTTTIDRETEVEILIGDLYWAWFDGVHRRDMATIETIAGTDAVIDWATGAFDSVAFTAQPSRDEISVDVQTILLDRPDCLVVSADVDYRTFLAGDVHSTVDVYFPVGDGWGFAKKYKYERELWQVDCDHLARRSS